MDLKSIAIFGPPTVPFFGNDINGLFTFAAIFLFSCIIKTMLKTNLCKRLFFTLFALKLEEKRRLFWFNYFASIGGHFRVRHWIKKSHVG